MTGVLALLERSLRVDARAWGPHAARFTLMIAVYFAALQASATSTMFGAPGLRFFYSTAYLNLVFMTLMGIGYFSTAITEEKEEDTLGLMLMAGISPLGILLGKSVGRMIQALLLVAIQYPFTLLAVTLGGVTQHQVQSAYVAMLSYMVLLSGVGLLCSTLARQNRSASRKLLLFVTAYILIPTVCASWQAFVVKRGTISDTAIRWIAESCVFIQMNTIMTTGFDGQLLTHPMVITSLTIGGLGYLLSWALFGVAVRDLSTEPFARGTTSMSTSSNRFFRAGRPKLNAFVWKDFHFISGGLGAILLRIAFYVGLYCAVILFASYVTPTAVRRNPQETTGMFLSFATLAIALDAGLLTSRCMHDEVRGQTLATLMMLPRTTAQILYAKLVGTLAVWLTGPVILVYGILVLPEGQRCISDFFRRPGPPLWLIAHLLLIPHAAAVAALYVRWGALPVAICVAIASCFVSGSIFEVMRVSDDHPLVYLVTFSVLVACGGCHLALRLRAEALCAR